MGKCMIIRNSFTWDSDFRLQNDHTIGQSTLQISKYLPVAYGTVYSFQNAFGGNAYGTDFNAINGTMPQQASNNSGSGSGNGGGYGNGYDGGNGYTDTYTYYNPKTEQGWWNLMDSSWTKDDWEYDSGYGQWNIYDDETGFYYIYSETYDIFGAATPDEDAIY